MAIRVDIAFCGRNLVKCFKNYTVQPCLRYSNTSNESFLNGQSSRYIEDMYNAWLADPRSVHISWDSYFRHSNYQSPPAVERPKTVSPPIASPHILPPPMSPPTLASQGQNEIPLTGVIPKSIDSHPGRQESAHSDGSGRRRRSSDSHELTRPCSECDTTVREHLVVDNIIRSFQVRGHLLAKLDPLEIIVPDSSTLLSKYKLDEHDLDKEFTIPPHVFIGGKDEKLSLREIIARLNHTYCNHIGAEYMYIHDTEQCDWLRQQLETPGASELSPNEKKLILERLIEATGLEMFCAKKWPSEKRFGLEGCEMMIPAMKSLIDRSTELGVENIIIGMPHRGRLNVLVNVCRRPFYQVLTQFNTLEAEDEGCGDVKYHLGTYIERLNRITSKTMRMVLMANPSHLELINPIVQGRAKAEQFYRGDCNGTKTLSIILHGDAAFAGEGVVFESINLGGLPCYTPHGSIHIVVNNQIGFTTDPRFHRSTPYCTDVARVANAPILHVNADVPESVIHVSKIAAEWRAIFRKDVVLDLVSYRRNGHNETEEPMFTQPLMYKRIRATPPILEKYSKQLIKEGLMKEEEVKAGKQKYDKFCDEEFAKAQKETKIRHKDWIDSPWSGFFSSKQAMKIEETGVAEKIVKHILEKFSSPPHNRPDDFIIHKGLERTLKLRREMLEKRTLDWAMGEAVAFGSLLKDGIHVRLSGQDVERGTFSHRHHVIHHQTVDKTTFNSLNYLYPDQAQYIVCNSSLSEFGVLAFELGYSMTNPKSLVLFEGQFGDFVNNAQSVIDTMLCCGETKWARQCGLVLLLPHGMEGAGPEHSSARLERYLQLSSDDPDMCPPESDDYEIKQLRSINWIVANCTTPANLVHILRRQIALPFRKPLVVMTPKSLLRHPEARSSFDDILEGTHFKRLIPDDGPASQNPECVKKLIFCSGKVYYALKKVFKEKGIDSKIAISRIEQITPFPFDLVKKEVCKYSNADIVWCQEEHKNQGAWQYAWPRIETAICGSKPITYVGRQVSESSATGTKAQHLKEVAQLFEDASKLDDCRN